MNKKEERDNFWISVGPESGYLGTIAEETARKNDGGISPDGARLGWKNACDDSERHIGEEVLKNPCDYNCPPFCFGDAGTEECSCPPTNYHKAAQDDTTNTTCACGEDCNCGAPCDCNAAPCACGEDCHCAPNAENTTCAPNKDCDCPPRQDNSASGGVRVGYTPIFGADCDCSTLPLPGFLPVEEGTKIPVADIGPERQNTQE